MNDKLFKKHVIEQLTLPSQDSEQFLAYTILHQKYPSLTYWSMDGYSCDTLADYSIGLVWDRDNIIDWTTKIVVEKTEKQFWNCTTKEIVAVWMKINGETTKTKIDWVRSVE